MVNMVTCLQEMWSNVAGVADVAGLVRLGCEGSIRGLQIVDGLPSGESR